MEVNPVGFAKKAMQQWKQTITISPRPKITNGRNVGSLKKMFFHPFRTGDVELRCPVCSKTVKSRSFKAHMQYHKSQEQNKELLVCVYCDNKPFTSAISLKRHMLIHENTKPFMCKECGKGFRQKGSLTTHERVHSGIRFSCICGKLFITKSLLNRHQRMTRACQLTTS